MSGPSAGMLLLFFVVAMTPISVLESAAAVLPFAAMLAAPERYLAGLSSASRGGTLRVLI